MDGIKQISFFIALSILVILGAHYLTNSSHWLMQGYQDLINALQSVFAANSLGNFLSAIIALLAVPLLISAALALIYWAFKRQALPNYWLYLWTVWLILATLIISQG